MKYFRKTQKKRNKNGKTKKQYRRRKLNSMRNRRTYKQHGGNFNKEQIKQIKDAIKSHQDTEPFSSKQMKQYIKKLNDISQRYADSENYSIFYEQMIDRLEDGEFKEWIDRVHKNQMEKVETDVESLDSSLDSDDEFLEFAHRRNITHRRPHHRR